MQEDHVSMGWSAACKLRTVLDNLADILSVELLTAARGLQLRAPLTPGPAGQVVLRRITPYAGAPGPDRYVAPMLEAVRAELVGTQLRAEVEAAAGPLG
jgi:histidine ammonia-lyase